MTKYKLKKTAVYGLYFLAFLAVMSTIYLLEGITSTGKLSKNLKYVDKTIFNEEIPVVGTKKTIARPYKVADVTVVKSYYDYQAEAGNQTGSLIFYDNTYLQNSGVDYGKKDVFEVNAILDGTVIAVDENNLLGKIIQIRHSNELISIYQSLSESSVKVDDVVTQGQVIGKSGIANISKDLGNHLHFELIHNGQTVNPETYFDKNLNEI